MKTNFIRYPEGDSFNDFESIIHDFWQKEDIFIKTIKDRSDRTPFIFYEGPPSANGHPGLHHVISRTIKDAFCRYKTQKGYLVNRKAGWDAHGLPIELSVEKILKITKEDVGKTISIKDYNQKCKELVNQYKFEWIDLTKRIGYWVDSSNAYITSDNNYIESVWNVIKNLYEKNLVYKGYSIQPYSPSAGTGLSSHELNQPGAYKLVKDLSIVAQFKIVDSENDYLLAWTTTPWTLPANAALAVNKNISYVKIKTINRYTKKIINVIIAEKIIDNFFLKNEKVDNNCDFQFRSNQNEGIPWMLLEIIDVQTLIGKKYHPLFTYVSPNGKAFEIIHDSFVNITSGTGIVHIAPSFGLEDQLAANKNNIGDILVQSENGEKSPIVNKQGKFVDEITDFAGMYVKESYENLDERTKKDYKSVDQLISVKLKNENKAFLIQKYEHLYPHCWRTDKPILYYPLSSWFIKTKQVKNRLVELNKNIKWIPESIGISRFNDWLENIVDWNFSRDRFWGTPIPIWRTEDEKEEKCIGSIEELKNEIKKSIDIGYMKNFDFNNIELHRPFIDEVVLVSASNKPMIREKDIVDVWLDSGAMPYAQFHYPFENQDEFKKNFPADFIAEGVDQTRGWFFTLHVLSTMLHDSIAFKNVVVNGFVLDKNGQKMSKRLGNTIDPFSLLEKYGVDVIRWYIVSNANIHENIKFDIHGVEETERKFFLTLKNTYRFFALYANIDEVDICESLKINSNIELDQWIISKMHSTIKSVIEAYDNYNLRDASRIIQNFTIDDLSNWYLRLNRRRFWQSNQDFCKFTAFQILYFVLLTITKLAAPIAPFISEFIYKNLKKWQDNNSVHLTKFPDFDQSLIIKELEIKMDLAQRISSLAHSIRKKCRIRVRQPLSRLIILSNSSSYKNLESVYNIVKEEVNVKFIEKLENTNIVIEKKVIPNFKKIAKIHKDKTQLIANKLSQLSQSEIEIFEKEKQLNLHFCEDSVVSINIDEVDIIVKNSEGFDVATELYCSVALDTKINEELLLEGIAREIVNRVQNFRKKLNLSVCDKIEIDTFTDSDVICKSLKIYNSYVSEEVQARELRIKNAIDENMVPLEIDNNDILYVTIVNSVNK